MSFFRLQLYCFVILLALGSAAIPNFSSLQAQSKSVRAINSIDCDVLPEPVFQKIPPGTVTPKKSPITLKQLSTSRNHITDGGDWLKNNQLSVPVYRVPNPNLNDPGNTPDIIPARYLDFLLVKAIRSSNLTFLIYGEHYADGTFFFAVNEKRGTVEHAYDFGQFSYPRGLNQKEEAKMPVVWAVQEGKILYVSYFHMGYAKVSNGMNGYLSAIDTSKNKILWSSKPQVCNSQTFEIVGDVIISGYGFTAEPDYLYLLDKRSGEILQQIKLKTAPELILRKNNLLYVRCYDTDYLFEIAGL
ncbi:MAG TPA: hypothetical protein PKZ53_20905 [Acidobacteriota bacterium]|nr:hypothetical protein [Acidobacteriota bacterium]HNB71989.1 hypothetical protein [Acidobacteriota bacterium]HNG94968.1 hypothetical protein [Acidobacteriota bacterium]HNH81442.1 hypothetical protein [Acidobacteriota bacterium]HNJ42955.1 hypothetical protein [Acidobacteriota bacterium]